MFDAAVRLNQQVEVEREAFSSVDRNIIGALVLGALAIRWLSTGGPVLGDESWYLYLARSFGSEPAAAADNAWFHLLNRPLYYGVFHFGTFAGFTGFRWFASVVGAVSIALVYVVARRLGATYVSAACVAAALAIQREVVEYSAHGFPDPLASIFALLALLCAVRQRAALTFLLASCCVLSKESFVFLPFIVTYLRLSADGRRALRLDPWAWATVLLPTAYVGLVTLIGARTQGIALQGWANTPMSWKHAHGMWIGPELWPVIAWCVWARHKTWLLIWLGLPAFYVLWSFGLGRGLAPWYVIGPASLSAVAVSLAVSEIGRQVRQRFGRVRARLLSIALLTLLVPVVWSGILRCGSQLLVLRDRWPTADAGAEVQALLRGKNAARVLLVNCFWSFGYSHLRSPSTPADRAYWPANGDLSTLRAAAMASQVTIVCRSPDAEAQEQNLASSEFQTLLRDERYWVLERNCRRW